MIIWIRLSASGVICGVDRPAIVQLCEDEELLARAYAELRRDLNAGTFGSLIQNRDRIASIRDLAKRVIDARSRFEMTPASRRKGENCTF